MKKVCLLEIGIWGLLFLEYSDKSFNLEGG